MQFRAAADVRALTAAPRSRGSLRRRGLSRSCVGLPPGSATARSSRGAGGSIGPAGGACSIGVDTAACSTCHWCRRGFECRTGATVARTGPAERLVMEPSAESGGACRFRYQAPARLGECLASARSAAATAAVSGLGAQSPRQSLRSRHSTHRRHLHPVCSRPASTPPSATPPRAFRRGLPVMPAQRVRLVHSRSPPGRRQTAVVQPAGPCHSAAAARSGRVRCIEPSIPRTRRSLKSTLAASDSTRIDRLWSSRLTRDAP